MFTKALSYITIIAVGATFLLASDSSMASANPVVSAKPYQDGAPHPRAPIPAAAKAPAPKVGDSCKVAGGALQTPYRVHCWTVENNVTSIEFSTPDGADFWISRRDEYDLEPGQHIVVSVRPGDELLVTRPAFSWQTHTLNVVKIHSLRHP